jgi:hypothetical protein
VIRLDSWACTRPGTSANALATRHIWHTRYPSGTRERMNTCICTLQNAGNGAERNTVGSRRICDDSPGREIRLRAERSAGGRASLDERPPGAWQVLSRLPPECRGSRRSRLPAAWRPGRPEACSCPRSRIARHRDPAGQDALEGRGGRPRGARRRSDRMHPASPGPEFDEMSASRFRDARTEEARRHPPRCRRSATAWRRRPAQPRDAGCGAVEFGGLSS